MHARRSKYEQEHILKEWGGLKLPDLSASKTKKNVFLAGQKVWKLEARYEVTMLVIAKCNLYLRFASRHFLGVTFLSKMPTESACCSNQCPQGR